MYLDTDFQEIQGLPYIPNFSYRGWGHVVFQMHAVVIVGVEYHSVMYVGVHEI